MDDDMEELVVDNPDINSYRELLFNIVIQQMPDELRFMIQGRQDTNDIINNAINEIVQANTDDVDDVNPPQLIRNARRVTELERIYNNIRTLVGPPQQRPQEESIEPPQQRPQEESIEPIRINTDSPSSGGLLGGKLRKTSKKRPTARRRRSSKARKARKSRSTRRR